MISTYKLGNDQSFIFVGFIEVSSINYIDLNGKLTYKDKKFINFNQSDLYIDEEDFIRQIVDPSKGANV